MMGPVSMAAQHDSGRIVHYEPDKYPSLTSNPIQGYLGPLVRPQKKKFVRRGHSPQNPVMPRARIALALLILAPAGCGRMEWNWDWAWWRTPRRVVTPSHTTTQKASDQPDTQLLAQPTEPDRRRTPSPADELIRSKQEQRPFYQLYLLSRSESAGAERGEKRVALKFAKARPCATLLEMLCVPLGRSGNLDECYLLYEDRNEFDFAAELIGLIDCPAVDAAPALATPDQSYAAGIGLMLTIAERGAVVEQALIESAEKRLAEALLSTTLSADRRWAAGVMASRLCCEYKYDYAAAIGYASQAQNLARDQSIQRFTAMYWRADALSHGGRAGEAAAIRGEITRLYGPQVTRSQLTAQAKSLPKTKKAG